MTALIVFAAVFALMGVSMAYIGFSAAMVGDRESLRLAVVMSVLAFISSGVCLI